MLGPWLAMAAITGLVLGSDLGQARVGPNKSKIFHVLKKLENPGKMSAKTNKSMIFQLFSAPEKSWNLNLFSVFR